MDINIGSTVEKGVLYGTAQQQKTVKRDQNKTESYFHSLCLEYPNDKCNEELG